MARQRVHRKIDQRTTHNNGRLDQTPLTSGTVQLTGEDGNAFGILARVCHAIRESNHPELERDFIDDATSGDYDHLLFTCMRYVEVR